MSAPKWTIYCHTHIDSGRCYIGLTRQTMEQRWIKHIQKAQKLSIKGCAHFWNAIRKYGSEAFSHEILEYCDSLEVANLAEQCWIEFYDSTNPEKGFNLVRGGAHVPHPITNPWDRPEFREANLPRSIALLKDPTVRAASVAAQATPESIKKKSERVVAQWKDSEIRARNEQGLKDRWQDPIYRNKAISASQAITKSEGFRASQSQLTKELWGDPEYADSVSDGVKERFKDPEERAKLSRLWDDPEFREKCSAGPKAASEAARLATHCKRGHLRQVDDSTPDGWARECHICHSERRKSSRTHCPKGHEYIEENILMRSNGTRLCRMCLSLSKQPKPCSKCGQPKTRKSGPDRFRCGPCTDARIAEWETRSLTV